MPVAAAAGVLVASWGAGTVVTAVVVGAVNGLIAGAVIGAATSLITGDDIIEGTLKGALIGGITGGVLNGVAEGVWGAGVGVKEATAGAEYLAGSPNATLPEAAQYGKDYVATPIGGSAGGGAGGTSGLPNQTNYANIPAEEVAKLSPASQADAIRMQFAAQQSIANEQALKTSAYLGLATGTGTGIFQLAGAKMQARAAEEATTRAEATARSRVESNQAANPLQQRIMKFQLPEAWTTAISSPLAKYHTYKPGLLQPGGTV